MIVKILTRHQPEYAGLIRYILKHHSELDVVTHNLKGKRASWAKQFRDNDRFRKVSQKKSIRMTHEIISFSSLDNRNITKAMLADISREYINLRGKEGLFVIAPHFDKEHIHLHACVSGTKLYIGEAFRLSKTALHDLKQSLERFVAERYPEIEYSFCQHGTHKPYRTDRHYRSQQREADKTYIQKHLSHCLTQATSQQQLLSMLMHYHDIVHYERKGQVEGFVYRNTKYRLARLGVADKVQALPVHTKDVRATLRAMRREQMSTEHTYER